MFIKWTLQRSEVRSLQYSAIVTPQISCCFHFGQMLCALECLDRRDPDHLLQVSWIWWYYIYLMMLIWKYLLTIFQNTSFWCFLFLTQIINLEKVFFVQIFMQRYIMSKDMWKSLSCMICKKHAVSILLLLLLLFVCMFLMGLSKYRGRIFSVWKLVHRSPTTSRTIKAVFRNTNNPREEFVFIIIIYFFNSFSRQHNFLLAHSAVSPKSFNKWNFRRKCISLIRKCPTLTANLLLK